jgi:AraC-like DNA-binding protein
MTDQTEIEPRKAALRARQAELSALIADRTVGTEDRRTAVPNLMLFRREAVTGPCRCRLEPSIVLVTQGAKQMLIGESALVYDNERFLLASLDLPGSSQVLEASPEVPCLGLALKLDLRVIAELIAQMRMPPKGRADGASAAIGTLTPELLEPIGRLLALLREPEAIAFLAPAIEREIHYRLLQSDLAPRLLQIVSVGSPSQRIARAIDWLKVNYGRQLRVEDLADHVQMSPSSLHQHFRHLTAMSPLQYQKWLRLNEARRLMLNESCDAASAAYRVGYDSPSQFSREYSRLFGLPPKRDVDNMRKSALEEGLRLSDGHAGWDDAARSAALRTTGAGSIHLG